jgi:hypothetical protein
MLGKVLDGAHSIPRNFAQSIGLWPDLIKSLLGKRLLFGQQFPQQFSGYNAKENLPNP